MSKYLQDPDYLFSILTAIVKKNNGKITISEKELKDVSKGDLIGMYYEPKTGNFVLKEVEPQDLLQAKTIINDKIDTGYDN
tara:strand:- start:344 stop:586 length:243 start_codon:yes stop_codon:yes gene_type:complete